MNDHPPASRVLRPSDLPAYVRGGGARTIPLVGPGIGADTPLNGITEFAPGAAIPLHTHHCEESVVLLEGEAIAEIDGVRHALRPLDTSWVPAGVPHRFTDASDTAGMRILWIYARPDATRTLVETGETGPVADEHAANQRSGTIPEPGPGDAAR